MLEGKVAVVTGAGRGLGKSMALVFAREGAKVVVVDFSGAQDDTAAEIGPSAAAFHADLAREADVKAMFEFALRAFGRVDVLVNNAATLSGYRPEFTEEEFEELMAVNLRGLLHCCRYGIEAMERGGRGGSIINVSTAGAINAMEEQASVVYSAAKAGVNSVTRSLAIHHGRNGIRINALAPGLSVTERTPSMPAEWIEHASKKSAIGRLAQADEHAEVAVFLASDWSSYVTGTVVPVDGGWTARLP
jgi:NAD(P)-dependent dehydrogenase (short-subunit alcohol dehydrogenase family)